jgi:hypothetical protein
MRICGSLGSAYSALVFLHCHRPPSTLRFGPVSLKRPIPIPNTGPWLSHPSWRKVRDMPSFNLCKVSIGPFIPCWTRSTVLQRVIPFRSLSPVRFPPFNSQRRKIAACRPQLSRLQNGKSGSVTRMYRWSCGSHMRPTRMFCNGFFMSLRQDQPTIINVSCGYYSAPTLAKPRCHPHIGETCLLIQDRSVITTAGGKHSCCVPPPNTERVIPFRSVAEVRFPGLQQSAACRPNFHG